MNRLLDEAKWMNGAVWTAVMFIAFAVYELHYLGMEPTWGYFVRSLVIWGSAGAGYAILTGYFARKRAEDSAKRAIEKPGEATQAALPPEGDRATRRRAQKERMREQKK